MGCGEIFEKNADGTSTTLFRSADPVDFNNQEFIRFRVTQ
jgi:hypothetical protein